MKLPCVYILAADPNGTLYVGVTSDLVARVWQHKSGQTGSFTSRYGVRRLVWFERHDTMPGAILREKQIKKWRRAWKINLIEETNPQWIELYDEIAGGGGM